MNNYLQKSFKHFTGNRNYTATPLGKIQTLASAYPYFPVAQYFLAKKCKDENADAQFSHGEKSVLYFSNPLWFDHLLRANIASQTGVEDEIEPMTATGQHEIYANDIISNETIATEVQIESAEKSDDNIKETGKMEKTFITKDEPDEHEKMFLSIKAMLDATTEEASAEVNNTEIPIDPYYTVDYFASQGIRLDFDPNPQDKLGQNLKKFTHWLKHMKKLGPEDAKVELESQNNEAVVQKLADTSNNAKEIVTEAMATVLAKQGKKDKSIELYNKLSFLNPEKRTYFAAQIEKLKGL